MTRNSSLSNIFTEIYIAKFQGLTEKDESGTIEANSTETEEKTSDGRQQIQNNGGIATNNGETVGDIQELTVHSGRDASVYEGTQRQGTESLHKIHDSGAERSLQRRINNNHERIASHLKSDVFDVNISECEEWIIDEERNTTQHGESIQIIEIVQGEGYVSEYHSSDYRADARKNGRGKGKDSRENSSVNRDDVEKSFSLKNNEWHTDLNKSQMQRVMQWLRRSGNPEMKRITDTACWYKGRIDGEDLFVIYSTEDATVMYLTKGENAKAELNILINLLEEIENGDGTRTRADGKSIFAQRLSRGNWVQNVDGGRNNLQRLGTGGHNQNAGVLQGQSERIRNGAFRNVIEDLLGTGANVNFSLKEKNSTTSKDTKKLLDTIEKLEVTKFAKADPKKLTDMVRGILKDYDSRADFDGVRSEIDELYNINFCD